MDLLYTLLFIRVLNRLFQFTYDSKTRKIIKEYYTNL